MKDKEKNIDDFLLDRLPNEEKKAFEASLKEDLGLSEEVKIQQEIMGGLSVIGRDQFKERLRRIQADVRAEEEGIAPKKKTGTRNWICLLYTSPSPRDRG